MKSLSRRFLISVGLMSLVMTVLGTFGAFVVFERELSSRQIDYLTDYVRERSRNVDRQSGFGEPEPNDRTVARRGRSRATTASRSAALISAQTARST